MKNFGSLPFKNSSKFNFPNMISFFFLNQGKREFNFLFLAFYDKEIFIKHN